MVTVNQELTLAGPVSAQSYTRGTAISPLVLPQVTGGTGTPTYTLRGEPAGLTFDGPTRTLSGRPTAATNGAETLTYTATDEAGATESLTFEVTVNQELAFAETVSAKFYTVGRAVDTPAFPEATGGTGGLAYTLTGVPADLTYSETTRTLSGTPSTAAAAVTLIYTVTDEAGATESLTFMVTVNPAGALMLAGQVSDQSYTMGTAISPLELPSATGGTGGLAYTLTGVPAGLAYSEATRTLSGTPTTAAAAVTLTYTVTDEATPPVTISLTFMVTVNQALTLDGQVSAQSYTMGTEISPLVLPQATGGTGTPTYTLTGEVAGLTFDGATRTLSGRPTAEGTVPLTYTVTDEAGATKSLTFMVTVNPAGALAFAGTVSAQSYTVGTEISPLVLPEATDGVGSLTYTLTGVPAGLAYSETTRTLSGTPTTAAAAETLTYTATDEAGTRESLSFEVTVNPVDEVSGRINRVNQEVLSQAARAITEGTFEAVEARIEAFAVGSDRTGRAELAGERTLGQWLTANGGALTDGTLRLGQLVGDSSFVLPFSSGGGSESGFGGFTFWGRGDYQKMSGVLPGSGEGDWETDLWGGSLGVDARLSSNLLGGLAASWYRGRTDYTTGSPLQSEVGEHTTRMLSLHPYVGWVSPLGVNLWAALGYGEGTIDVEEQGTGRQRSDSELRTASVGMGGDLFSGAGILGEGRTTLRLKGAVSYARLEAEGGDLIERLSVSVRRLRLGLRGAHEHSLSTGGQLRPSVEVGVRYDEGDGETGPGAEVTGSLRYVSRTELLTLEGSGSVLVAGPDDYDEWGANALLRLDPGADKLGASFSLRSVYGMNRRLAEGSLDGLSETTLHTGVRRAVGLGLDTEFGYGLSTDGVMLWTPYSGLSLSENGTRSYRLGGRLELGRSLEFDLEGARVEGNEAVSHGVLLQGRLRF